MKCEISRSQIGEGLLVAVAMIASILGAAISAAAQDIAEFKNGYVTFTNLETNLYYRLEYKPNLTGQEEWTGSFKGLKNIQSSDFEVSVPVGVFYRVIGSEAPAPSIEIPQTGQTWSYGPGDDGDFQNGVSWLQPRFTNHSDGTVTDNFTGLMWVRAPHALPLNSGTLPWDDALIFCNTLIFANYSDWRLPNLIELQSLIDYGRLDPALPEGHPFMGIQSVIYWTSSTTANNTSWSWHINLFNGRADDGNKVHELRVLPVRGGQ